MKLNRPQQNQQRTSRLSLICFALIAAFWSISAVVKLISGTVEPVYLFCALGWIAAFLLHLRRYRIEHPKT